MKARVQTVGINYQIEFLDNKHYRLIAKEGLRTVYDYSTDNNCGIIELPEYVGEFRYGEWINNGFNKFRVILNGNFSPERESDANNKYSFTIKSRLSLIGEMSGLSIAQSTKESSILNLTING